VHAIGEKTGDLPKVTVRRHRGWIWWTVGTVLAGALLMFCYLRIAGTTEMNSDAAGLVLQSSDMLHGNLLLHGWWDTDVSFITTELPEYMAVTAVAGMRPEVVHICAALTYTLLVLLAAFVARGRARGAEGVVRALIAAGVMLAPQAVNGPDAVLLGSPDHVGSAVPLLLLLLLIDRVPIRYAWTRWLVPVCVAVLLAWAIVGDALIEVIGVVPLVIACLLRAVRIIAVRLAAAWARRRRLPAAATQETGKPVTGLAGDWDTKWLAVLYHVLLAAAAAVAVPLSNKANALIAAHGGYQLGPDLYGRLPWHVVVRDAPMVWQSVLALFGADYKVVTGPVPVGLALAHLAGVAMVALAVLLAVWRMIWPPRGARTGDLVADVLVLAILVNIAAYVAYVQPSNIYSTHEIGPVVSIGAALAGRMLGGPLLRVRTASSGSRIASQLRSRLARFPWAPAKTGGDRRRGTPVLVAVLAAWLACYAAALGIAAASPQAPPQDAKLATWLGQHHLRNGLASYWEASPVTVETGGRISMLAIGIHGWNRKLAPDKWETDVRFDNPARYSADFVVAGPDRIVPVALALEQFGKPARTYHFGPYTIMVWNKNLLGELNPI